MYSGRRIGSLVLACSVFGKEVVAAEWAVKGNLGQQLQYNDNISLLPGRKDSVAGYLLTPDLQATLKTKAMDLAFKGQADIRRYNDSRWDCDNFNLGANSNYRTNRNVFSLYGEYGVSCSYVLQIADTGLILPNSQSENYRVAPSWTWQWTARDRLILDASYSKTSYSQAGFDLSNNSSIFSSNDMYTVNLNETHDWSRRLALNGNLYFSTVKYTGPTALTQDLFGFQLGGNYKIDRFWTVGAGGGPVWVNTRPDSNEASSFRRNSSLSLGSVAEINISYNDRLTNFSTGYSNAVSPSAIGQTLQTQSVFANYSYRISRRLMLDFSGNYSLSESVADESVDSFDQFDRTYYTLAAGITWDLAKHWQLKGSYVYSWQDYQQGQNQDLTPVADLSEGASDSNLIMLFLNYSWDGVRISR
jgi:hypothetical protein